MMLSRNRCDVLLVCCALSMGGCTTLFFGGGKHLGEGLPGSTEGEVVKKLDPTRVGVTADKCLGTGVYDASQLLEAGNEQFNATNFERARNCFALLAGEFPDDSRRNTALYNLGVTNIRLGRLVEAEEALTEMLVSGPLHPRADDARLELGLLFLERGEFSNAAHELHKVVENPHGEPYLIIRAMALLGRAAIAEKEYVLAEDHLWRAFHGYKRAERDGDYVDSHLMGTILFYQAGIKDNLMEDSVVVAPRDNSKEEQSRSFKSLEAKASWLVDAQKGYLRVIRVGNRYWATAAGYRIGVMYESLHRHLAELPAPDELNAEESAVYREELNSRLAVLLRKSVRVFKKVCSIAKRLNLSNQWVKASEESLSRLMVSLEVSSATDEQPRKEQLLDRAASTPNAL